MTDRNLAPPASRDPHALLEQAFVAEYLADHGYRLDELADLPREQARALMAEASRYAARLQPSSRRWSPARALMAEASRYASARLAEVEARAHFVEDIDEGRRRRQR